MISIFKNLHSIESIDLYTFAQSIANALHPLLDNEKGIDCIIGKNFIVSHNDSSNRFYQEILNSEKEKLKPFLEKLPLIHGKMSQNEINEFMDKYSNLPGRPPWFPTLYSPYESSRRQNLQTIVVKDTYNRIQEKISTGQINAFNANHTPIKFISIAPLSFISKKQALNYLNEIGLEIQKSKNDFTKIPINYNLSSINATIKNPSKLDKISKTNENQTISQNLGGSSAKAISKKNPKWTNEKLKELYIYKIKEEQENRKNSLKRTAEYFKISTGRVTQLLLPEVRAKFEKEISQEKLKINKKHNSPVSLSDAMRTFSTGSSELDN